MNNGNVDLPRIESYNSEAYPILRNSRMIPIPYIDYNMENDDFLLFRTGGVYVSSSKWFIDHEYVHIYEHEESLMEGDYVDFKLVDRDPTVRVSNLYLTFTEDNQKSINVGFNLNRFAFYMLFTMSGEYVSPSKYKASGSTITFIDNDQPLEITKGDRLELVVGMYLKPYSKTVITQSRVVAVTDNQTEFTIDLLEDFNPKKDTLFLFQKNGLYIGERFYSVDTSNKKIIIDRGSSLPLGDHIDVFFIRTLISYATSPSL
jgi:hypothetical protein